MEFWGIEVKVGETLKCEVEEGKVLHLSQAALGELKNKGSENVPIFVNFNDQKLVLGTLSQEKCPQIQYDLVFEKQFELSHTSKNASVYFCGYKTSLPDEFPSDDDFSDSDEEDVQIAPSENGKVKVKNELGEPGVVKANAKVKKEDKSAAKAKVKKGESVKVEKPKASDDEDDSDDEDGDDDSDDEDMLEAMGDSDDDEDDSSDDEDEETPKKAAVIGQKRPAGSAAKTPVPEKKAKVISPAGGKKTGGDKKGGHTATPHPAKQTGKTPTDSAKSKQQSPKSAGSVSCKACSKTFSSGNALEAHSKAKHAGAK